ncbi:MAG: hypothetical protein II738_00585, partial [Clostridia bacterium]|nr:hypothetical protein [Clostridia bacterium]
KELDINDLQGGTVSLVPDDFDFDSDEAGESYDLALVISGSTAELKIDPTAANKNYMVKTFLNEKVTDNTEGNSYYKRTESIPVRVGDTVYIGVGERAWPSMNKYGAEARAYTGTWYAFHVINAEAGADYVNELIDELPAVSRITYDNYAEAQEQIATINAVMAALSDDEQANVNTDALAAVQERVAEFAAIDEVKALLGELPNRNACDDEAILSAQEAIEAAYAAYEALEEWQQGYLTVGDYTNYNGLVERLSALTATTALQIKGNGDGAAEGSTTEKVTNDDNSLTITTTHSNGHTIVLDSTENVSEGENEFNITSTDDGAVVVVKESEDEDGGKSYEKLTITTDENGEHSVTLEIGDDAGYYVAFKGDVTGDGSSDSTDANQILRSWVDKNIDSLIDVIDIVGDVTGDGGHANATDANQILLNWVNGTGFAWDNAPETPEEPSEPDEP